MEQKRELVKVVTKAIVDIAGATPQNTDTVIQDVPKTNWGQNGALASDLPPKH